LAPGVVAQEQAQIMDHRASPDPPAGCRRSRQGLKHAGLEPALGLLVDDLPS
jgi:hypothetical protein